MKIGGSSPLLLVALMTTALMAGCLGGNGSMAGYEAYEEGAGSVPDDAVFLGMVALEGPFDVERLEQELQAAADDGEEEAQEFLDAFDLRVRNGEKGDGRTGSWFLFHQTEETGIITQVFDDDRKPRQMVIDLYDEVEAEEVEMEPEEPESGVLSLAPLARLQALATVSSYGHSLARFLSGDTWSATEEEEEACERPITGPYGMHSVKAAKAAMADEAFGTHFKENPDAEVVYLYGWDPEATCADGDEPTAGWIIVNVDLDRILVDAETEEVDAEAEMESDEEMAAAASEQAAASEEEEARLTLAYAVIDGRDYSIIESDIEDEIPMFENVRTTSVTVAKSVNGGAVPTLGVLPANERTFLEFDVEEDADTLSVEAMGSGQAPLSRSGTLHLRGPDGDVEALGPGFWYIDAPAPGTWSVRYVFDSMTPFESHFVTATATQYFYS